jgi:hypothetical protein
MGTGEGRRDDLEDGVSRPRSQVHNVVPKIARGDS